MKTLCKMAVFLGTIMLLVYLLVDKYNLTTYLKSWTNKEYSCSKDEFVEKLREGMLERKKVIELPYRGDSKEVHEFVGEAINQVFEIDDPNTTSDFDYLKYCYLGTEIRIQGMLDAYTITYTFQYSETKEQTDLVSKAVRDTVKELGLSKKTSYEKIKIIHDYIIKNTTYDIKNKKNSAYDNLIGKSSICQGYALVTYKMMKEAGVDCRIITGEGKGVSHAWNIVLLDGRWYNIDCTWDDPVSSDKKPHLEYTYFLKSNADFSDHIRDEEFDSTKFNEKYKMSEISY